MKDKIAELLMMEFCSIYCWNCRYNDDDDDEYCNCEDCHRKYMNWSISKHTADRISTNIDELYRKYYGKEKKSNG